MGHLCSTPLVFDIQKLLQSGCPLGIAEPPPSLPCHHLFLLLFLLPFFPPAKPKRKGKITMMIDRIAASPHVLPHFAHSWHLGLFMSCHSHILLSAQLFNFLLWTNYATSLRTGYGLRQHLRCLYLPSMLREKDLATREGCIFGPQFP